MGIPHVAARGVKVDLLAPVRKATHYTRDRCCLRAAQEKKFFPRGRCRNVHGGSRLRRPGHGRGAAGLSAPAADAGGRRRRKIISPRPSATLRSVAHAAQPSRNATT